MFKRVVVFLKAWVLFDGVGVFLGVSFLFKKFEGFFCFKILWREGGRGRVFVDGFWTGLFVEANECFFLGFSRFLWKKVLFGVCFWEEGVRVCFVRNYKGGEGFVSKGVFFFCFFFFGGCFFRVAFQRPC